jgi:hypothetical protein
VVPVNAGEADASGAALAIGGATDCGEAAAEAPGEGAGTTSVTGPDPVVTGEAAGEASIAGVGEALGVATGVTSVTAAGICPIPGRQGIATRTANAQHRRIFPPKRFIDRRDLASPCCNLQLDATNSRKLC